MSAVGAALILGVLVAMLIKWKIVRPVAAVVCVLFGLVLGVTPLGGPVNTALSSLGAWVSGQVGAL